MPGPTKVLASAGRPRTRRRCCNLATSLFEHGRIKTTEPKARALRPVCRS